jgi:hypothetical protein
LAGSPDLVDLEALNPAWRHMRSSRDGGRPSVPSPAPPGSDSPDGKHEPTELPYSIAATGRARLSCQVSPAQSSLGEVAACRLIAYSGGS